ncbi:TadG family pilus assembly protein [Delftia sp. UME58]|uniref:TadG family pilus assembly protein n=1 Tax=Delftia sp. UME58 TaxID=1862322 RepID=UPI001603C577|nr:TadG family pilus assembly protein [Delftia sp. UME58]MBB1648258.1 hypothetical protein [Delftia sp. UME58]
MHGSHSLRLRHCGAAFRHAHRQGGGILVQFALLAGVLILMLGVVDMGYMYYAKRDLQRIADLAAMEAAQHINAERNNTPACVSAGQASINDNWPAALTRNTARTQVACGNWNAQHPARQASGGRYFDAAAAPLNAAHVVVAGSSPTFFPGPWDRLVVAEAIAMRNESVASFQVGSQLLRFNKDTPLGSLLGVVGLDVGMLTLLDSKGLADAKISPAGLLKALGVNLGIEQLRALSPEGLANIASVTLLDVIDASISAITDNALAVQLNALKTQVINLGLSTIKIPLGSLDDQKGLFAFLGAGRTDPLNAAMDVQLGIGDVLKTAIAIGANGHALKNDIDLLGIIKAKLTIVQPPTIAVGPVGTQGYSAQIRLNLNVDTDQLLGGALQWLVKDILGTQVKLPIAVDITNATGTLTALQCSASPQTMDLSVKSSILNACVGKMDPNNKQSCEKGLQDEQLITLLRLPVLTGKLWVPALEYTDSTTGLGMEPGYEDPADPNWTKTNRSTQVNQLALGDTVDNIVTGLLNLLSGLLQPPGTTPTDITTRLLESYLDAAKVSGLYNVASVTSLLLNGRGVAGDKDYMPPLLTSNFTFNNAIAVSGIDKCGLVMGLLAVCPSSTWPSGTFSAALNSYTSVPGGLLGVLGISTYDNGYLSCAGLLSSLFNWNGCVKHNVTKLLTSHPQYLYAINANSPEIQSLLNRDHNLTCTGALCTLLKPLITDVLKPILNGVGDLLTSVLKNTLGLEVGRTDIKALSIGCDTAQLVF